MINLPFEIREREDSEGGLWLELFVDDRRIATAGADEDVLAAMEHQLGLDRQEVAKELERALEDVLTNQLDKVAISDLREDPNRSLRFRAKYTYLDGDNVETGLVWYDINTSATGPKALPATVLNKMRFEVHRRLTGAGGAARALVDIHE